MPKDYPVQKSIGRHIKTSVAEQKLTQFIELLPITATVAGLGPIKADLSSAALETEVADRFDVLLRAHKVVLKKLKEV